MRDLILIAVSLFCLVVYTMVAPQPNLAVIETWMAVTTAFGAIAYLIATVKTLL